MTYIKSVAVPVRRGLVWRVEYQQDPSYLPMTVDVWFLRKHKAQALAAALSHAFNEGYEDGWDDALREYRKVPK